MTNTRQPGWLFFLALACALFISSATHAQDQLARARSLYESADYEQALQVLAALKATSPSNEAAAYQVFCLVALGRTEEARTAVQAIVKQDPLFRPQDNQVSPRIRAFFDDVRKPMLPDIARQAYTKAKTSFEQKDWVAARDGFSRVVRVLDELSVDDAGQADLRTLAAGFRDLAINSIAAADAAAAAAKPPPLPSPTPTAMPVPSSTPLPPPPLVYSDSDIEVVKPIAVNRSLPQWRPTSVEARTTFSGALELLIDEAGKVTAVKLIKSVNARYDAGLLTAAKAWTFKPATKDGTPVKYRYVMSVNLEPPK